jgi:uncharacterized repeat protein (TIGR04138 family)
MADASPDPREMIKQHIALRAAVEKNPRYHVDAYRFICEAVEYTCTKLGGRRDVSGRELLEGICALALSRFGYLARIVFEHWGITRTDDFGEMVFILVEVGLLGKSPRDSMADFHEVFGLREALDERYRIDLGEAQQEEAPE